MNEGPRHIISPHQDKHAIHLHCQSLSSVGCVYGLWDEPREPRENSCRHKGDVISTKKDLKWGLAERGHLYPTCTYSVYFQVWFCLFLPHSNLEVAHSRYYVVMSQFQFWLPDFINFLFWFSNDKIKPPYTTWRCGICGTNQLNLKIKQEVVSVQDDFCSAVHMYDRTCLSFSS